jgi:large subunit ribosomal protein L21
MFAIIKSGGKQHEVREGQELKVELLPNKEGDKLDFEALLVSDDEGKEVKVGTPTVSGVKVSATVVEHGKAKKVSVIKFKAKSRYRRNVGHRQPFTKIKIEKISA